jgi:hypothetical protein
VTNVGNDRGQLSNMANQAREEIEAESLTVVADRGYYKGLEILACEQAGITTFDGPLPTHSAHPWPTVLTDCAGAETAPTVFLLSCGSSRTTILQTVFFVDR